MPAVQAPSPVKPCSLGSSLLLRSSDVRSRSCGSMRRSIPKRELSTPPGMQLAPIEGRIPTPSGSAPEIDLYLPMRSDPSKSSLSEALVEWKPKKSGKLTLKTKAFSDLTQRICMTIPRSLSFHRPKSSSSAPLTALDRLNWAPQINPRVEGPSGMLLRLENLRKAAIKLHSELQKNRLSLRFIRQGVERSKPDYKPEIDNEQLQALPSSPTSRATPKSKKQKDMSVTCSFDLPMYTAELKGVLDAEAEKDKNINKRRF